MKNSILQNCLQAMSFKALNDMQSQMLDAFADHKNIQLLSPTGSGKTFAFLLPLYLQMQAIKSNQINTIIIAPTRELVMQITQVWRSMKTDIKVVACFGGHRIETELNELLETPQIVIATPGRLLDHLQRASIKASFIQNIVIDEFDKTLELGFLDELENIWTSLNALQKKVFVSATEMEAYPDFIDAQPMHTINYLSDVSNKNVDIKIVVTENKDKIECLVRLLNYIGNDTCIVFVNHREAAERLHELLVKNKIESVFYHGGLEQLQRTLAIIKFQNNTARVLIASDIASRGLDIDDVGHIIHYHLPTSQEAYIHRNGRTARQEARGAVYVIQHVEEQLEPYITENAKTFFIPDIEQEYPPCKWMTIQINAGKKNKINKIDIVGFLSKIGKLHKHEIGKVIVLDTIAFVAIDKSIWKEVLAEIRGKKIKGKDYIFKVAK